MSEGEILISAIEGVRRKLNLRVVFGAVLGIFPYLCGSAAVLILAWRLASALGLLPGALWFSRGGALPLLIGICAGGIPVLAVFNWSKRLDRDRAAQWLDERLHSRGVLTAALACLDRKPSDEFTVKIFEGASDALLAKENFGRKLYPHKNLRRGMLISSAALAFCIILVSFWNPLSSSLTLRAETGNKESPEAKDFKNPILADEEKSSDADLARRLFPGDKRLEALAEQALRDRDSEALAFLMKESGLNPGDIPGFSGDAGMPELPGSAQDKGDNGEGGSAASDPEPEAENEQNSQGSSGQKNGGAGHGAKDGQTGEKTNGGADKQNRKDGAPGAGAEEGGSPKGENTAGGSENENGSAGSRSGGENSEGGGGGKEAGNGTASERAGLKNKKAETAGDAVIKYRDKGSPLQFAMPGKTLDQTLARVIPDARRSSEAAMSRSLTPLEYEAFVKSYFTALSKESKQ